MTTETRSFKIHRQLLFDVIQRQAGTLTKALCEGVMNSIDAGASKVAITLSEAAATITDDGKGFRDRREIEDFFETFGQPHHQGDATYGTFRMGRGQLFSFGVNRWRSGDFRMDVDIKGRGLDYTLHGVGHTHPGCRIEIDLYSPLGQLRQREIADDLRRAVRYVPVPVLLDGEQLNRDPRGEKWDLEDDDAYYKFADGRLSLYSLGVFVCDHRAYSLGIGGTVVTKQQLRLNFARNDILSDCAIWQRVAKVLRGHAEVNIKRKREMLSTDERALLARRLRAGELGPNEAWNAPVFQDASGRWLSAAKLCAMRHTYNATLSAGAREPRGERVMRARLAIVLNEERFDQLFNVDDLPALIDRVIRPVFAAARRPWQFRVAALNDLSAADECYTIVPPAEHSASERVVLRICGDLPSFGAGRRIVLGDAVHAYGWTDGWSYIAISRQFLEGRDIGTVAAWSAIALLLAHEYAHVDASTSETHVHSPEFYEAFHDLSHQMVPKWIADAMRRVQDVAKAENAKLTRAALRVIDNAVAAKKEAARLAAKAANNCHTTADAERIAAQHVVAKQSAVTIPAAPIVASKTNAAYQARFDRLHALATAGDWDGVRGYRVGGCNSYAKQVARYQAALIAVAPK